MTPRPPAAQTEISPREGPSRSESSLASAATMRPPVAPNGWPAPSEPPWTLSLARSIEPSGSARPSLSEQNAGSSHAFSVQRTWAANASWIS